MEEAPENGQELSHSEHANGLNEMSGLMLWQCLETGHTNFLTSPSKIAKYEDIVITRSARKDTKKFKLTVFSVSLVLLGFVPCEVPSSTFYTMLPAFLPVLEAFLECLF